VASQAEKDTLRKLRPVSLARSFRGGTKPTTLCDLNEDFNCAIFPPQEGEGMLIWLVGVAIVALLVIADIRFMRARQFRSLQAAMPRRRRRSQTGKAVGANLSELSQMKQPRVYDSFGELFVALDAKAHNELFAIAEDERIPASYTKMEGQPFIAGSAPPESSSQTR
jgi:hypothetical protein